MPKVPREQRPGRQFDREEEYDGQQDESDRQRKAGQVPNTERQREPSTSRDEDEEADDEME